MSLNGDQRPRLEHVELIVESDGDAAARLAPSIVDAVRRGERVYTFVDESRTAAIRDSLPADVAHRVEHVAAGQRYGHPAKAMKMLADIVARERRAGTPRVHSIGEIPFVGDRSDREWIRYESAVYDVFADVALRAVCLYDPSRVPEPVLDAARRAHHEVHGAWASLPNEPLTPARAPDLLLEGVDDPTGARHAVDRVVADWGYDAERRADLALVLAELMTNAVEHARSQARVRLWREADRLVASVDDDGPGVSDPYVGLRPPWSNGRGAGLWMVAQLCDEVDIRGAPGGGSSVTVTFLHPTARS